MKFSIKISLLALLILGCKDRAPIEEADAEIADNPKREVLVVGTFHFNNPGADVAKIKSFNIMNDESQAALENMSIKIAEYRPTKIFVEWEYDEQQQLDSLYNDYLEGNYFTKEGLSDFYLKNEIFQLAFRVGEKSNQKRIYGVDYPGTSFPFDSLMTVIAATKQIDLQKQIGEVVEKFTSGFDDKIVAGTSLKDLIYHLNSEEFQEMSNKFHNKIPLLAGDSENLIGPFLTSEWYKRNLYMWSQIQKNSSEEDQRIMLLLGASHTAILRQFMTEYEDLEIVELEQVMEEPSKK